jgi:hypothetical protein
LSIQNAITLSFMMLPPLPPNRGRSRHIRAASARSRSEKIRDDRFRLRRPRNLQANRLPTGLNNNPERQEGAALAFQVDEASELGQILRGRFEAICVAARQRQDVEHRTAQGIEEHFPTLARFGFSERARYR